MIEQTNTYSRKNRPGARFPAVAAFRLRRRPPGQPGNLNATALSIDPAGIIYAGTEGGIFTSTNGCTSWSAVNSGLTVDVLRPPVTMVIDPNSASTLYAGFDGGGIWKTVNSGGSWAAATTQPTNLRIKGMVAKDSNNLYAATYGNGLFKSTNSGVDWSACGGQPTNLNMLSLQIDGNGYLYAGTEAGVFKSTDNCGTWSGMNTGLPF